MESSLIWQVHGVPGITDLEGEAGEPEGPLLEQGEAGADSGVARKDVMEESSPAGITGSQSAHYTGSWGTIDPSAEPVPAPAPVEPTPVPASAPAPAGPGLVEAA